MTISFTKAALAVMIGLGSISAMPATASASNIDFYFGFGGPGVHFHDGHRRHDRWDRREYRGCSADHAERKARNRFGLRRAQVVRQSPHRVVVEGRRHHHFERVVFANRRGCPVIRY